MLSKSLIQFSVDGWGCVPSLLFDLRPNYGGGNEDNGHLLQKVPCRYCCTQCPRPCSRPPPTHTSAADSWTLMDKSGSVSCGVTGPFSCVLVHTRQPPPRVLMPYPGLLHPELLPLKQSTSDLYPQWETLKHSFVSVSVGSLGPGVHKVCLSPPSISGGCGFYSKCNFAPSTILLGLFLCPWMLGIIFGGIQLSPVNGYSAASCNFGALTGEDELMSFYSVILVLLNHGMFTWVLGQMLSDLLQR